MNEELWINGVDAIKRYGVSRSSLHNYTMSGKVNFYRLPGGGRRYSKPDLDALFSEKDRIEKEHD